MYVQSIWDFTVTHKFSIFQDPSQRYLGHHGRRVSMKYTSICYPLFSWSQPWEASLIFFFLLFLLLLEYLRPCKIRWLVLRLYSDCAPSESIHPSFLGAWVGVWRRTPRGSFCPHPVCMVAISQHPWWLQPVLIRVCWELLPVWWFS